jgi:hypothetical protein
VVKPRSNELGQAAWGEADPVAECRRICDAHRDVCAAFVMKKDTGICSYWKGELTQNHAGVTLAVDWATGEALVENPGWECHVAERDADGDGVGAPPPPPGLPRCAWSFRHRFWRAWM